MRPTFDPAARDGAGECADGGASSRWVTATFGPGKSRLEFITESSDEVFRPAKGTVQSHNLLDRWSKGTPKCLAVTVFIGQGGWQAQAPRLAKLYDLADGRCK